MCIRDRVYVSCRIHDNSKKLDEILSAIGNGCGKRREVMRAYREIVTSFGIKLPLNSEKSKLSKVIRELEFDRPTLNLTNRLVGAAKEAKLSLGKTPGSTTIAAIYIAHRLLGKKLTQRRLCSLTKTTEVTLRSRIREMMSNINIEIVI